jgi:hypothetical protein
MPRGTYHHLDPDGSLVGVEVFSCAPGPAGWRYVSQLYDEAQRPLGRLDLTVDDSWRQVRVLVTRGDTTLRGGIVGPDAVWVRDDGAEQSEQAVGFTGASPAFAVVTARLLRLDLLDRRRLHLVRVTEPAALPLAVDEGWALVDRTTHEQDGAMLDVERYEVADLATAERRVVHLAGDVVLDAPGVSLEDLESPPTPG